MKKIEDMRWILSVSVALIFFSCSEDEAARFTSPVGSWTYTTPDESIKVEFDLVGGTTDVIAISNQVIYVNGEEGRAEQEIVNVNLPNIERIRINANDVELQYPYSITFRNLTVSEDFMTINAEEASYTIPDGTPTSLNNVETLNNIQITRLE